ncbi:ABC transporter ATP-binding protein [Aquihabitans sp. McL0605]|uniref:ABC transporter ATP-binding protein n=1 Tax=Aquihabitans sp. McL0605 TaxID=3415671 RepID=UPI003CEEE86F
MDRSSHPPALALAGITVTVTDGSASRTILDEVSIAVWRGEMVAVMGPSGAGKSTLIDVCCGLVTPTAGRISLGNRAPSVLSTSWWSDRRRDTIGVIHQRLNLLHGLTALDNVALSLDLLGRPHRAARAAARLALDRVGIAHVADTPAARLSVGEQQRVAIARGIVGDRPILLADEPAAALDRTAADQTTELLADLAVEGRAILLVTHDSQQASWAGRTVLLRDGIVTDEIRPAPSGRP